MKKPKLINIYISIALACILISGCKNESNELQNVKDPVSVEVQQVQRVIDGQEIAYSGTIEESTSTSLNFSSMGTIARVLVSEGQYVKKGQLLATLNNETFKNAYEIALSMEKRAEDGFRRLEPMYKNGTLPEIKFVEVESGLQQAKASAAIAKKNLQDCNLYSTVDGIVGKRSIDPGMSALTSIGGITIVNIDKVFARVSIPENEISNISKGQKANITIQALGDAKFAGIIDEVGVMADPLAHSYKIKIIIPNKDKKIKPGMICTAALNNAGSYKELSIPSHAVLVDEKGNTFVFALDASQNKAVRKAVKTGKLLKNGIEIIDGLNDGEQIVVTGQHKLVDNSLVHIIGK